MTVKGYVDLFNPSDFSTAGLGDEYNIGGATYQYFIAGGTLTAYSACTFGLAFNPQMGTTSTAGSGPVGVCIPQFDVTTNQYFWAPVGPFKAREDNSSFKVRAQNAVAGARLYLTSTPGVLDDEVGVLVPGLILTSSVGSAAATACVAYSRMIGNQFGESGSNGTATLSGGAVTISNSAVAAGSSIAVWCQSASGVPGFLYPANIVAGSSFDILSSSAGDNSVVGWEIMGS